MKVFKPILIVLMLALYPAMSFAGSLLPPTVLPERQSPLNPPPDGGIQPPTEAPITEEQKKPQFDEAALAIKFKLNKIEFEGNTLFTEKDFHPIYKDKLGTEISLAELQAITEEIEKFYVSKGYILTRVIIPPQEIDESGVVKLQVVEGFVSAVVMEGDTQKVKPLIEALIQPVLESKPLQINVLERAVLLVNDISGVTTKAVLTPSFDVPGSSTLVLLVDQEWFEGSVTWDDRGTKYVGPNQFSTTLGFNNLFQHPGKLFFDGKITSATRELKSGLLGYTWDAFDNGSKVTMSYTMNRVQPGNDLSPLEVDGTSNTFALIYRYPIIRSRRTNLSFRATYDYLNSETDILKQLVTLDRIESIRLGFAFDAIDNLKGINLLSGTLSQGLNMLSGEEQPVDKRSRFDGRKDYTKVDLTYTRLQYLPDNFSLFFSTTGQYAFNALLSAEEIGYGGAQYGSAYDSSEIIGDSGVEGKLELRYNYPESGDFFRSTQYYASYDGGVVWDKHLPASIGKQSGTSAAVGIRLGILDRVNASFEFAKPLTRKVAAYDNKDPRFFFSITSDISPGE